MPLIDAFCCVACGASLDREGPDLRCAGCRAVYPRLGDSVPVLVADPEGHLVASYREMDRFVHAQRRKVAQLEQRLARGSHRAAALRLMRDAILSNLSLVRELQRDVEVRLSLRSRALLSAEEPLRRFDRIDRAVDRFLRARGPAVGDTAHALEHFRRDWTRTPFTEEQIARTERSVRRRLDARPGARDTALVLGASTARFAEDLRADFRRVVAIDLAVTAALLHARLDAGVDYHDVTDRGVYTIGDHVSHHLVHREPPPATGGEIVYAIADACRCPLPDRSVSAIVAIYFTDVVPLDPLLREVRRLLVPGGTYVSYGPLIYPSLDPENFLSVDEVRERFVAAGFRVEDEGFEVDVFRSHRTMAMAACDTWCFRAVIGD